jgi:hypothetical protein
MNSTLTYTKFSFSLLASVILVNIAEDRSFMTLGSASNPDKSGYSKMVKRNATHMPPP